MEIEIEIEIGTKIERGSEMVNRYRYRTQRHTNRDNGW
jgi:hypothetical protein